MLLGSNLESDRVGFGVHSHWVVEPLNVTNGKNRRGLATDYIDYAYSLKWGECTGEWFLFEKMRLVSSLAPPCNQSQPLLTVARQVRFRRADSDKFQDVKERIAREGALE